MKKVKLLFFYIGIFLLFNVNVMAATTKNGVPIEESTSQVDNTFYLSCLYYNGDYIVIDRSSLEEHGNIDPDYYDFIKEASDNTLKKYKFMYDDGTLDCPKYIYGIPSENGGMLKSAQGFSNSQPDNTGDTIYIELDTSESICEGKCNGNQHSDSEDMYWTCEYTGPSGKLTTKYDGFYLVYFPDGSSTEVDRFDISSQCTSTDIFYNPYFGDPGFILANYDFSNIKSTDEMEKIYNAVCKDNELVAEYYCAGKCRYPSNKNLSCSDLKDKIDDNKGGGNGGNTVKDSSKICVDKDMKTVFKLIGNILLIAKIAVPILLIIMGSLDFGKVVVASDPDAIPKAFKMLVTRIIAAIVIFAIPTIVNFIFDLIPKDYDYSECEKCIFHPNKCDVKK